MLITMPQENQELNQELPPKVANKKQDNKGQKTCKKL